MPNTATSYNDHPTFVVLHHFALLPPSSAELQQVRGLIKFPVSKYLNYCIQQTSIPSSSFANNGSKIFPVEGQNRSQTSNHLVDDPRTLSVAGSSSTLEVVSGCVSQRGLGTPNADPDPVINEPLVDAALILHTDKWPPAEHMCDTGYTPPSHDTSQSSTSSSHRPTQDSREITFETASVSPYERSLCPKPHTNARLPAVSPPSLWSLADVLTSVNSEQWQDEAVAASETSSEVPNPVETFPASTTIQQNGTNITKAEKPNFCHLCSVSFTQPQVFRRHLKDKHEDKESCTHCSSFKWSRGRPHLYRRHLKLKHPQFTFSEDRPGRPVKLRAVGAHSCKGTSGRTEASQVHLKNAL